MRTEAQPVLWLPIWVPDARPHLPREKGNHFFFAQRHSPFGKLCHFLEGVSFSNLLKSIIKFSSISPKTRQRRVSEQLRELKSVIQSQKENKKI